MSKSLSFKKLKHKYNFLMQLLLKAYANFSYFIPTKNCLSYYLTCVVISQINRSRGELFRSVIANRFAAAYAGVRNYWVC